jgi:DNA-binding MarR family transcriptional regulator
MAQPIQLSDESVDRGLKAVHDLFTRYDPYRFRMWCEVGLTTAQLRVLFLIRDQPGVTAGELANRLSVTPPTVSGIVDRLVRMDFVRREEDPSDRRLVRNQLTEAGARVCGQASEGSQLITRRILVELSPDDLEALNRGLAAFISASQVVAETEPNLVDQAWPSTNPKRAAPAAVANPEA